MIKYSIIANYCKYIEQPKIHFFRYVRWIWKFKIKNEEYELEDKEYLIRSYMGASQGHYDVSIFKAS